MNIINRFKSLFTTTKTMSAEDWKKGMIMSDFAADGGVTHPFSQSTIVYVAASRISENLPQAPLVFYNTKTKTQLTDDPVVRLFRRPNEYHTYFTFFEELTLFLALYGETFIWTTESMGMVAGTSKMPAELVVLNPTRMQHVIDNHQLVGWLFDDGKGRKPIPRDQVLHIKFPNPYNPIRGLAPIDSVRTDVDTDFLASRFSKSFFQNSANPALVFTLPEDDESSKEQREEFLKEFNALRRGSTKQYKMALLNPGMDIKKTGLTQEEMDYIKQREFSAERILSVYGVPPPMAGFYEQATYGNVRTAKKIFWNETIKSYARRYESSLNNFFLPIVAPGIVCKFNFSDIDELKHDAKETADLVNIYANHGVPMNALIEAFELPFDEQDNLDIGYQSMTMLPVGTNFITDQQSASDTDKHLVDVTPSIFSPEEKMTLKYIENKKDNENLNIYKVNFAKNLHNYFYRQREKLLKKISKDVDSIDNTFWSQENDRLLAKFDPIYDEMIAKFGKSITNDIVSVNIFNKRVIDKKIKEIKETDQLLDEIRKIYGSFDKRVGKNTDSRINMISNIEINKFIEQNDV